MKLPKRFALSTLLLLMLVVASVFGYAQWRKQHLLRLAKQLGTQGAGISIRDDWFWPTLSSPACLGIQRRSDGVFQVGDKLFSEHSENDAKQYCREVASRMHELGIHSIIIEVHVFSRSNSRDMSVLAGEDWLAN